MMTISTFSSFLEFLAAIYTSMYFDRVFDFWSPKYKNNLKEALEKNNWTKDTLFSTTMRTACAKWYNGVRRAMLNRAAFMIISIVAILVFAGFEESLNNQVCLLFYSSFVITWILSFLVVLVFFKRFFFSKIKRMFLALLLEGLFFMVSFNYILPNIPSLEILSNYTRIVLLLFTLLPIVIQVISSWLSSDPYAEYLKKRLPSFKKEYDIAQKSLRTRDVSLVNDDFKKVITEMFVQGETGDTSMNRYQELLREKMLSTCQPKSILVVFWSWVTFQYNYATAKLSKKSADVVEEDIVYEMPMELRPILKDVDFAEEYKKYLAEKNLGYTINIRDYCKKNNIYYNSMVSWVKANKPTGK